MMGEMVSIGLQVNGRQQRYRGDGEQPLLWYLRDELRLTGSKYGCGVGQCGACTVHVNGDAARSCVTRMASLQGARVRSIEGLATGEQGERGERLHAVQQAWIDEDVAQCGYCQAGQIMSVVAMLAKTPRPSDADIDALTNLCRCGTHLRIRKAIRLAAQRMAGVR